VPPVMVAASITQFVRMRYPSKASPRPPVDFN
jgi:hypothetical protein